MRGAIRLFAASLRRLWRHYFQCSSIWRRRCFNSRVGLQKRRQMAERARPTTSSAVYGTCKETQVVLIFAIYYKNTDGGNEYSQTRIKIQFIIFHLRKSCIKHDKNIVA